MVAQVVYDLAGFVEIVRQRLLAHHAARRPPPQDLAELLRVRGGRHGQHHHVGRQVAVDVGEARVCGPTIDRLERRPLRGIRINGRSELKAGMLRERPRVRQHRRRRQAEVVAHADATKADQQDAKDHESPLRLTMSFKATHSGWARSNCTASRHVNSGRDSPKCSMMRLSSS